MEEFEQTAKYYNHEKEVILDKNLKKMRDEMQKILANESLGVNANMMEIDEEMYPAQAINGYINNRTGEIIVFENMQHIEKELKEGNGSFTLRIAGTYKPELGRKQNYFFQAEFVSGEGLSDYAKTILNETIEAWNSAQRKKAKEKANKTEIIRLPHD